jgi:mitogen-activated protein kinase 15
MLLSELIF